MVSAKKIITVVLTVLMTLQLFSMGSASYVFADVEKNIAEATVSGIEIKDYTGQPVVLDSVTLKYDGVQLLENTDYVLSYKNNIQCGRAELTIDGQGSYKGTITLPFEIRRPIHDSDTEEEARALYDSALATKGNAEEDLELFTDELSNVNTSISSTQEEYDSTQESLNNTKGLIESTVTQIKNDAEAALTDAEAEKNAAYSEYEDAKASTAEAQNNLDTANENLTNLESNLESLNVNKTDAEGRLSQAESEIQDAEDDVESATNRWNNEKLAAQQALEEAQENYENAGMLFINEKINDLKNTSYGANCKTIEELVEDIRNESYVTSSGKTIAQIAADENFEDWLKRSFSYNNQKRAIELIKEGNRIRTSSYNNVAALKVNYQLIAGSHISSTLYHYTSGHAYFMARVIPLNHRDLSPWIAGGNATLGSENLYVASSKVRDPFAGWYCEEKIVYLAKRNNNVCTAAMVQSVVNEANELGISFSLSDTTKYANDITSKLASGSSSAGETGHYESLISNTYKTTGLSFGYKYDVPPTGYIDARAATSEQAFNTDTSSNAITVDQYEQELDAFFEAYSDALEAAEAAVTSLENKPQYVVSAEATLTEKQTAYDNIQTELNQINESITSTENDISNLETEIQGMQSVLATAISAENSAKDNYDEVVDAWNAALAAKNQADNLDVDDHSTFAGYDDLVDYADTYSSYLEESNQVAERLQSLIARRTALESAVDEYENCLRAATEDVANAREYLIPFYDLGNAIIEPIDDHTYSGNPYSPVLNIWNKGRTVLLEEGAQYSALYENNTNVGNAVVRISGFGNAPGDQDDVSEFEYFGENSISFRIVQADIANADIEELSEYDFSGNPIEPTVTLYYGDKELEKDVDYDVNYSDNNMPGTGKVMIIGKGNFTGTTYVEFTIKPHTHTLVATQANPSTCIGSGNNAYWTCSSCHKYFSDENGSDEIQENSWITPQLNHNLKKTDAKAATCTEAGNNAYWTCSVCNKVFSDNKATTETTVAKMRINVLNHDSKVTIPAKQATCTATGLTEGKKCSRCGTITVKQNTVKSLGHDSNVTIPTKQATCTATGLTEGKKCSRCGTITVKQSTTKALGHKYGAWTKLNATQHQRVCAHDKKHIEKANHAWDAGKVTKQPTTAAAGVKTFTCTVCKAAKTETIAKLPVKDSALRRIHGTSRFKTSFAIAETYMKETKQTKLNSIIVASSTTFPDALAGSYLAKAKNAPIIIWHEQLNKDVQTFIKQKVKSGGTVYILGGPVAVGESIKKNMGGYKFVRLADNSRYGTNTKILDAVGLNKAEVLVCDGGNDGKGINALIASATGRPLLLVDKNGLIPIQKTWLGKNKGKITKFVIVGDGKSVSAKVESELKAYGAVTRISGKNGDEVSAGVASTYYKNAKEIFIATMDDYPDGLCGGPLAIFLKGPILLVNAKTNAASANYAKTLTDLTRANVLGGDKAMPEAIARKVAKNTKAKIVIIEK